MYRTFLSFGRNVHEPIVASFRQPAAYLSLKIRESRHQSTRAKELKNSIPEFWILKMKTAFTYHDVDGDGYITEKDFVIWAEQMEKRFPISMSKEQKETLENVQSRVWGEMIGGRGKGPDYKVTEGMFIEKFFDIVSKEGAEDKMRKEWHDVFEVMDLNQDGVISKNEHRQFFEARKNVDPNGAIVAFSAMDTNMDGRIKLDEYVDAGTEFFFNFADEAKPSKHFFGPLVKI